MIKKHLYRLRYTCFFCGKVTFYFEDLEPNPTWWVSFECSHCKQQSDTDWFDKLPVEFRKCERYIYYATGDKKDNG